MNAYSTVITTSSKNELAVPFDETTHQRCCRHGDHHFISLDSKYTKGPICKLNLWETHSQEEPYNLDLGLPRQHHVSVIERPTSWQFADHHTL